MHNQQSSQGSALDWIAIPGFCAIVYRQSNYSWINNFKSNIIHQVFNPEMLKNIRQKDIVYIPNPQNMNQLLQKVVQKITIYQTESQSIQKELDSEKTAQINGLSTLVCLPKLEGYLLEAAQSLMTFDVSAPKIQFNYYNYTTALQELKKIKQRITKFVESTQKKKLQLHVQFIDSYSFSKIKQKAQRTQVLIQDILKAKQAMNKMNMQKIKIILQKYGKIIKKQCSKDRDFILVQLLLLFLKFYEALFIFDRRKNSQYKSLEAEIKSWQKYKHLEDIAKGFFIDQQSDRPMNIELRKNHMPQILNHIKEVYQAKRSKQKDVPLRTMLQIQEIILNCGINIDFQGRMIDSIQNMKKQTWMSWFEKLIARIFEDNFEIINKAQVQCKNPKLKLKNVKILQKIEEIKSLFKQDRLQMKQLEIFAESHRYNLSQMTKRIIFVKGKIKTIMNIDSIFKSYRYLKRNNVTYIDNISNYMQIIQEKHESARQYKRLIGKQLEYLSDSEIQDQSQDQDIEQINQSLFQQIYQIENDGRSFYTKK